MTFLPIVDRELRVAARSKATYRNRTLIAGVLAAIAILMMLFGTASRSSVMMGGAAFRLLSCLTLLFCLLEGVRKTADCLSEEKREGTIGLLFLTDLKGYDIVFGKLAATSLNSFYGLMSILPVLALPLLLGGVTPGEFWRVALAMFSVLFFSLCTGIWISSWSRESQRATGGTFGVIAALSAIALFVPLGDIPALSPVYAFRTGFDANYFGERAHYWQSLWIGLGSSCVLLIWASFAAPRCWQDQGPSKFAAWTASSSPAASEKRTHIRHEMLDQNPILWLAVRKNGRMTLVIEIIALAAILLAGIAFGLSIKNAWPFFIFATCIVNLMIKMRIAAVSSRCFAEARRNSAMEMLLTTPLSVSEVIQGHIQALYRMSVGPILIILGMEAVGLFICAATTNYQARIAGGMVLYFGYFVILSLDIAAVFWAGMWFGLRAKSESHAATQTILWVLIAPFLFFILGCFGLLFFVVYPLVWFLVCRAKVYEEFRKLRERTVPGLNPVWLQRPPLPPVVTSPPVIRP